MKFNLQTFNNSWYKPGSSLKISCWMLVSRAFFETFFPWPSGLKRKLLTAFGADIAAGVVIKPRVQIKYPWFLKAGKNSWIGERVWIDNLGLVTLGENSILSQGVYLCTGNHNYKLESFDLMVGPIVIGNSVWIGAMSVVGPGVTVADGCVVSLGSVIKSNLTESGIYSGNPAVKIR